MQPRGNTGRLSPKQLRQRARDGTWQGPTAGCCDGYVQANLVVVPQVHALDFFTFCQRNPQPCPLIEQTEPGQFEPRRSAPDADLRTDLPGYLLYRDGVVEAELQDLLNIWNDDLVAFLLGCSFTFEAALLAAGIPLRHLEQAKNVPMYITNVPCHPAGRFAGPLVVSMRPIPHKLVDRAVGITACYPLAHGAPIHIGDPAVIGIANLEQPDFGDSVTVRSDEVPVFWACGVTPQAAAAQAKPDLMITHMPGCMFVTDLKYEALSSPTVSRQRR